jgi:hypothetical protein
MKKDLFTKRLISLLAVQDGLIPASSIGVSIKQPSPSIKNQLHVENIVMSSNKKRRSYVRQNK